METPQEVLNIFHKYNRIVEGDLLRVFGDQKNLPMYKMMEYFLGFRDEKLKKQKSYGGKRFRSGILLLISDFYQNFDQARTAACSLELFHNFTLIHDDIFDNDPERRGRKTVWKLWGENQAINTGDAQLILSFKLLSGDSQEKGKVGVQNERYLSEIYSQIIDGQYLDLSMTELPLSDSANNEDAYIKMIASKTSVIIGGAAKSAGILAGKSAGEQNSLFEYGYNLGVAYQLCDDLVSIWGSSKFTGKIEANDLLARKKTLPVIYSYIKATAKEKKKFIEIYDSNQEMTRDEVEWIVGVLNKYNSYEYVWKKLEAYKVRSEAAVRKLNIEANQKKILTDILNALLPNIKKGNLI